MIYTQLDTFYLSDEQLRASPSRSDGVDEETETMLRLFGCELIQEGGILLELPQAVMATGQVLFHRFFCKKSFTRFNVKKVAASCLWLAAKLEESPRRIRDVLNVFHRMECRRENLPLEMLEQQAYDTMKAELIRTERHLLKEMGFICHVEHPHKFVLNYLLQLGAPELIQEGWNLANDSLRTTLCVRFKSEVVACGVVYAAARRSLVPLPEDPPWWLAFDAEKADIDEVCKVLAMLYKQPKARYIDVCKEPNTFLLSTKAWDPHLQNVLGNDTGQAASEGAKEKQGPDSSKAHKPAVAAAAAAASAANGEEPVQQLKVSNRDEQDRKEKEKEREREREQSNEKRDRKESSSRRDSGYHSRHSSREKDRHRYHPY